MKRSHLYLASTISLIAALGGCGGSGTPLPGGSKVAVVTFMARTTAAMTPTLNKRINDYAINGFTIPAGLSVPVDGSIGREKEIQSTYLNSLKTNAFAFGSYSSGAPGKSYLTLFPTTGSTNEDLGFGKLLNLSLNMGNQNSTKADITSLLLSANPSLTASSKVCPQNAACDLTSAAIPVFYNISVSIQTK